MAEWLYVPKEHQLLCQANLHPSSSGGHIEIILWGIFSSLHSVLLGRSNLFPGHSSGLAHPCIFFP